MLGVADETGRTDLSTFATRCCISLGPASLKLTRNPDNITEELCEKWKLLLADLPATPEALLQYLNVPLQDDEKVPISRDEHRKLIALSYPNTCTANDLAALFRVTEDEEVGFLNRFIHAIEYPPPPLSGTEDSFHSFWDTNIQDILAIIFPDEAWVRNSNQGTSTGLGRPDFVFLIRGVCAFRGEEKPRHYTGSTPRDELVDKLYWTYDPAPYIIGGFITFPHSTRAHICRWHRLLCCRN